jgi:hypothetical protein
MRFRNILGQEDVAASWCASHSDAAPHCPNNGVRHVNATDRRLLRRSGRLCSGRSNKPAKRIPKSTGKVRTGGSNSGAVSAVTHCRDASGRIRLKTDAMAGSGSGFAFSLAVGDEFFAELLNRSKVHR